MISDVTDDIQMTNLMMMIKRMTDGIRNNDNHANDGVDILALTVTVIIISEECHELT